MKRNGIIKNNRGVSLIELVIGVTILAVIISPLLRAIFVSAGMTSKSEKIRNANLTAQNIIETIQASELDTLLEKIEKGQSSHISLRGIGAGADASLYKIDEDGNYSPVTDLNAANDMESDDPYFFGLKDIHTDSDTFDAMIELDPDDQKYKDINDREMVSFTPIENVYSQPSGDDNPDISAADYFADMASLASGEDVSRETILHDYQNREMTIDIEYDGRMMDACVKTYYSVEYLGESYNQETSTAFYRGEYDEDDPASLYIFYYPNYANTSENRSDTITINNKNNLKVNVFLVKQDISGEAYGYSEDNMYLDSAYNAILSVHESYDGEKQTYTSVYSNLNKNIYSEGDLTDLNVDVYSYKNNFVSRIDITGDLVSSEKMNRIYELKVSIFKANESFDKNALIYTCDSTKLR